MTSVSHRHNIDISCYVFLISKELTNDAFREQVGEKEQPAEGESKVEDNEIDYDVESIEQMIRLKIPSDEDERVVSSYCAICLDRYKLGDNIVWSISPNCRHVFHRDCLVDGLTRVKNDNSPCPCCRAKFCDFPSDGHMQAAAASCGS